VEEPYPYYDVFVQTVRSWAGSEIPNTPEQETQRLTVTDEEQIRLASNPEFWTLIEERRRQKTIRRAELERRLDQAT
jgi:hypothetical protein